MLVNLVKPFVDFDNKPVLIQGQPALISKELATGLAQANDKENPLRIWEISKKLYAAKGEIELDQSDLELIKKHLNAGIFSVGFTGQTLELIAKGK